MPQVVKVITHPLGMRIPKGKSRSERGANWGRPPSLVAHCPKCCANKGGATCVDKKRWRCGAEFAATLKGRHARCPKGHIIDTRGWL